MIKICDRCGREYETKYSYQKYCCKKCKNSVMNERQHKKNPRRVPPREIVCARCGETFMGRFTQKYCIRCLMSGDLKLRTLYKARTGK